MVGRACPVAVGVRAGRAVVALGTRDSEWGDHGDFGVCALRLVVAAADISRRKRKQDDGVEACGSCSTRRKRCTDVCTANEGRLKPGLTL